MDFDDLMKKTKEVEEKLMKMRDNLSQTVVTGKAGGGLIEVDMFVAGHDVKRVRLSESFMREEKSVAEILIAAGVNDAVRKAEEKMKEAIGGLAGSMPNDMTKMLQGKKEDSDED